MWAKLEILRSICGIFSNVAARTDHTLIDNIDSFETEIQRLRFTLSFILNFDPIATIIFPGKHLSPLILLHLIQSYRGRPSSFANQAFRYAKPKVYTQKKLRMKRSRTFHVI